MAWLKAAMGDGYMGIGRSSFMESGTPANCMVIIVLMMSSHVLFVRNNGKRTKIRLNVAIFGSLVSC